MIDDDTTLEQIFCTILRGERSSAVPIIEDADTFLAESAYHGVRALLYHQLERTDCQTILPADLYAALRHHAVLETALEAIRHRELRMVLDRVAGFAPVLLMKGAALAFSHYPAPALRMRGDTDLLIRRTDLASVERCFKQMGYTVPNAVSGELLTYERCYVRENPHGVSHSLDLHWRINNSQSFAESLTFDELAAESVAIPQLGEHARGLGNVHALMLACIHRISHMYSPYYVDGKPRYGGNRLIWLYDIHLLDEAMTAEESFRLIGLAQTKKLSTVCADGLAFAQAKFNSTFRSDLVAALTGNGCSEPMKLPGADPAPLEGILRDFRALPSWRKRATLAKEHLFPGTAYMRSKYQINRPYLLPFCYGHRAVKGIYRLLKGVLT